MRLNIKQGSKEWLELRKQKITATDIGVIRGESRWSTPLELWKKKLGLMEEAAFNDDMRRGIELEPIARNIASEELFTEFQPAVYINDDLPWAMASLDGIDSSGKVLLEIKCPRNFSDKISDLYMSQMQWQLFVTGADLCYYCEYVQGQITIDVVKRCNTTIKSLIEDAQTFRNCLLELKEPTIQRNGDLPVVTSGDAWVLSMQIATNKRMIKEQELQLKQMEQQLLELTGGQDCICGSLKITKCERKGSIEYDKIPELKVVDLEQYRKASSQFWIFKEIASG